MREVLILSLTLSQATVPKKLISTVSERQTMDGKVNQELCVFAQLFIHHNRSSATINADEAPINLSAIPSNYRLQRRHKYTKTPLLGAKTGLNPDISPFSHHGP